MYIALTSFGKKKVRGVFQWKNQHDFLVRNKTKLWKKSYFFFQHNSTYSSKKWKIQIFKTDVVLIFYNRNFNFWSIHFRKYFWKPQFLLNFFNARYIHIWAILFYQGNSFMMNPNLSWSIFWKISRGSKFPFPLIKLVHNSTAICNRWNW